jgi:hypothetical protein
MIRISVSPVYGSELVSTKSCLFWAATNVTFPQDA